MAQDKKSQCHQSIFVKIMGIIIRSSLILLIFYVYSATVVSACYSPPKELYNDHKELISNANTIILAKVEKIELSDLQYTHVKKPVVYIFNVIEVLKGEVKDKYRIQGEGDLSGIWNTTFNNHSDSKFWKSRKGRMGIKGDCSMVSPLFIIGETYLLVLDGVTDLKQYEKISSKSDEWLLFVRKHTKNKHSLKEIK